MTKKLVLGSLLAALVLFVWGFIAWAVLSDKLGIVEGPPGEAAVIDVLDANIEETGAYFFPVEGAYSPEQDRHAAWIQRHTDGPIGMVFFRKEGLAPSPVVMLEGFLHFFAAALLAALILKLVARCLAGYWARVKFVAILACFAAIAIHLSTAIWWYYPWGYTLYSIVTLVVGWTLAGLVLATFVTPAEAAG